MAAGEHGNKAVLDRARGRQSRSRGDVFEDEQSRTVRETLLSRWDDSASMPLLRKRVDLLVLFHLRLAGRRPIIQKPILSLHVVPACSEQKFLLHQ